MCSVICGPVHILNPTHALILVPVAAMAYCAVVLCCCKQKHSPQAALAAEERPCTLADARAVLPQLLPCRSMEAYRVPMVRGWALGGVPAVIA